MKKKIVMSVLGLAVFGCTSIGFAASSPYSDVPSDHWAYGAVSKLSADGVLTGYPDGSFKGDRVITRYEMAQIVANATTKNGLNEADQKLVDKLAEEFRNEFKVIGHRMDMLEKKVDHLKVNGLLRLDTTKTKDKNTVNKGRLRLNIAADIEDGWTLNSRIDYDSNLHSNTAGTSKMKHMYAQGPLAGGHLKAGRIPLFDAGNLSNGGTLLDTELAGAEYSFGNKLKTTLRGGRIAEDVSIYPTITDYAGAEFALNQNKWKFNAGIHSLKNNTLDDNAMGDNKVWSAGFDYSFTPTLVLGGMYADSDIDAAKAGHDDGWSKAGAAMLSYKGVKVGQKDSFGIWLGYRYLGKYASFAPTYLAAYAGERGYEIGVDYALKKNIINKLIYFEGNEIDGGKQVKRIFERVEVKF